MKREEYLKVLELESQANWEDIEQRYQDLNSVWEPQRFVGEASLRKLAIDKLQEINTAYQALKDLRTVKPSAMKEIDVSAAFATPGRRRRSARSRRFQGRRK